MLKVIADVSNCTSVGTAEVLCGPAMSETGDETDTRK
jgi:hypothetical protein